ncbi:unnamed protein product [Cylicocyclus nassatus]|uniref:Uncharacterized protein n=1 Tax=Cylicocyclus nassatus TaxID=53992 RepID=A0AA36H3U5_CYLNA|nr:unnamed protein product [Cylicocyclus nassatus]
MEPSTSPNVSLSTNKPARVHSLSTSTKPEVPSAPPDEPSTSPCSSLPTYEQARVHSLSALSAKPEVPSAPPEYEEVDTTISRRIIQTTFPEPSTTIMEQPTPIHCASSCNVSCSHSHNEEPSTSLEFPLPAYEEARVHSLSIASAKPEVPSAPPEYEEVDTTVSGRIVQTTQSFLNQNRLDMFHDQTAHKIQTTLPKPSTTIIEQPTPIPCASSCNVSCHHGHNDICRRCKQKEDEETAELCINLCVCIFGICALALSSSKS